jgi:chromosome partitioning protein
MIITIASFKGGVGKTTTAIHLSGYLAKKGTTLLVDGDPNKSSVDWAKHGLLPFEVTDQIKAPKFISSGTFKNIVIDTQARPDDKDIKDLAESCDLLIIPITPDALAIQALSKMLDVLSSIPPEKYKILLTMIPPPPSKDGQTAFQNIKDSGLPIFKTLIRRYTALKKASLYGCLVSELKDNHSKDAWEDYKNVGKEVSKYENR